MLSEVGETQADWSGHVIVCGPPGVGLPIVEELTLSGVPAVVIDDGPAPALARMIAAWGVPLITGHARAEETLISAGLAGAIAGVCAQENDLSALETALLVRRLPGAGRGPGGRAARQPGRRPRGPPGGGGGSRCRGAVRPVGGRGLPGRGRPGDVAVRNAVPRRPHH